MAHLYRVIVPVSGLPAADPFGNPLCFASRSSVFTGRGHPV
jgi:hypothetical protein